MTVVGDALGHIRICDLSGQLAGAGATRVLAAFGAQVIRIEDPVTRGLWDIVRQLGPYLHDDRGPDGASGFVNHNVEKLGITLNLRTERGKELLAELVRVSNAVTENFAAGVMERLGLRLRPPARAAPRRRLRLQLRVRPDRPVPGVQVVGPDRPGRQRDDPHVRAWPATSRPGGATRTWTTPAPTSWASPCWPRCTTSAAPARASGSTWPASRAASPWADRPCSTPPSTDGCSASRAPSTPTAAPYPAMAPHGIYPCRDADTWVAIACRHDEDWSRLADVIGEAWAKDEAWSTLAGRLDAQDRLDGELAAWTAQHGRDDVAGAVRAAGIPVAPVQRPSGALRRRRRERGVGPVADGRARQARPGARRRAAGAPVGHRVERASGPGRSSGRTTSRSTPRSSG